MSYGKVIFGDNQFLGVNHASQAMAAELYERFNNPDRILDVIGYAYDAGIQDFMFTPHERYTQVFDEIRRSNLFPGLYYTPCIPYAHKYWNMISDRGIIQTLGSTLFRVNINLILPAIVQTVFGKPIGFVQLLTKIETLMCQGLPIRGVFLQNLGFDLLMAMELYGVIESFSDVSKNKLGIQPGFITMNHPQAVDVLCNKIGLERPWICSNYNVLGFRMNPTKLMCEKSFASQASNNIAMSVMASGQSNPASALDYVVSSMRKGHVKSILFGSSSRANINKNYNSIAE